METKEKEAVTIVPEKESTAKKVGKVLGTVVLPVVLGVGAVAFVVKKMVDIENGKL